MGAAQPSSGRAVPLSLESDAAELGRESLIGGALPFAGQQRLIGFRQTAEMRQGHAESEIVQGGSIVHGRSQPDDAEPVVLPELLLKGAAGLGLPAPGGRRSGDESQEGNAKNWDAEDYCPRGAGTA